YTMDWQNSEAVSGNVAGMAKLNIPASKGTYEFYVTYDFSSEDAHSEQALTAGLKAYEADWKNLIDGYKLPKFKNQAHEQLYKRSIFTLRIHEDKAVRGAMIASLSKPWGDELFEHP